MFSESYIIITSREEYDNAMCTLDSQGCRWASDRSLLNHDLFDRYFRNKKNTLHLWPNGKISIALLSTIIDGNVIDCAELIARFQMITDEPMKDLHDII